MKSFKILYLFAASMILASCSYIYNEERIDKTYQCAGGAIIKITYINSDKYNKAILHLNQNQYTLNITESASGARYSGVDKDDKAVTYMWHTKGEAGSLFIETSSRPSENFVDCMEQ